MIKLRYKRKSVVMRLSAEIFDTYTINDRTGQEALHARLVKLSRPSQ